MPFPSLQVSLIPAIVVICAGTIAAITDVWKFKVYNVVTIPLLLSGLAYHTLAPWGEGIVFSLLGTLLGLVILISFYILGGVGAGDVKLLAGCGAWLGPITTFYLFIFSGLATGVYAVALLIRSGGVTQAMISFQIMACQVSAVARHLGREERIEDAIKRPDRRRRVIPFAAMVAVGLVFVVFICTAWQPA